MSREIPARRVGFAKPPLGQRLLDYAMVTLGFVVIAGSLVGCFHFG